MELLRTLIPWRWRRLVEVSGGWGLALELCHFEEHWSLHVHAIAINLYFRLWSTRTEPIDMIDKWGFSVHAGTDWGAWTDWHFSWRQHTKIVHMPWSWEFYRRSILATDGRHWVHELASHRAWADSPCAVAATWFTLSHLPHWKQTLPYRYVLHSGEIQNVNATISVDEMEWRWRWFSWLPWPRKVRRSIDIDFSGEVGERTGSWKGGCTGCSYELRPDESPASALKRMMNERKF